MCRSNLMRYAALVVLLIMLSLVHGQTTMTAETNTTTSTTTTSATETGQPIQSSMTMPFQGTEAEFMIQMTRWVRLES
jgi:hypothetical protein